MALDEVSWGAMLPKSLFSAEFNIQVSPSAIVVTPPTVSGPKMPTISPSMPPQPSVTPGSPKPPGSGPIVGSAPIASGIAQKCPAVSEGNARKLQAMIFSGDGTYNGSFLAQPAQGKYSGQAESTKLDTNTKLATEETVLGLTQNAADAIPIFLDPANGVLTAWKRYTVDRYGNTLTATVTRTTSALRSATASTRRCARLGVLAVLALFRVMLLATPSSLRLRVHLA